MRLRIDLISFCLVSLLKLKVPEKRSEDPQRTFQWNLLSRNFWTTRTQVHTKLKLLTFTNLDCVWMWKKREIFTNTAKKSFSADTRVFMHKGQTSRSVAKTNMNSTSEKTKCIASSRWSNLSNNPMRSSWSTSTFNGVNPERRSTGINYSLGRSGRSGGAVGGDEEV